MSRELHTPRLLPAHVPVGYWWQNTRSSILLLDRYSCDFVSHPNQALQPTPEDRRGPSEAQGRARLTFYRYRDTRLRFVLLNVTGK